MDGVGNTMGGVLVLGATNVPWELDPGKLLTLITDSVRVDSCLAMFQP
jgi:SpoVK/Ycf46/Vps4 family AAA+-type ATPase